MEMFHTSSRRYFIWRQSVVVFSALLTLMLATPANAGGDDAGFEWGVTYVGAQTGFGRAKNKITDVDGFANWGNTGAVLGYEDSGYLAGALAGKRLRIGGVPLRLELDAMFGDISAKSNRLDPEGLDETVVSEFRWVAAARVGVERSIGPVTVFVSGGVAAARFENSVTDIDSGVDTPPRMDPDDSFRDVSTGFGWTLGLGLEVPLDESWTLRLEGSYMDFGRSTHYVNRSGDNRCGPEMPRRPCPYDIDAELGVARLAIIYRFSW